MNIEDFKNLQVGDRIEFRAITRFGSKKAVREITGFPTDYFAVELGNGEFEHRRSETYCKVRYDGTDGFYVRRDEIIRTVEN